MENQNQAPASDQGQPQNQYQQQSQQYQPPYQPNYNVTNNYNSTKNQSVVSIGDWMITFILMALPLINFIMLFVWAFGSGTSESKANWAKATLIFYLIGIILVIAFWGSIAALIGLSSLGS